MKKTLAIILSAAMVLSMMVGMFTFVVTSADEVVEAPTATFVKVYPTTGDAVTLNATNTTFNGTTGTAVFDAAKGELTITDLTGVRQIAGTGVTKDGEGQTLPNAIPDVDGTLTVIVKGTNTIVGAEGQNQALFVKRIVIDSETTKDVTSPADLIIKGDGTLNVTGGKYTVGTQAGNLVITEKVKLNVTTTAGECIHVANSATGKFGVTFSGDSVTTLTTDGTAKMTYTLRVVDADGTSYVKDNAVVNATNTNANGWHGAARFAGLVMDGGEMTLKVTGTADVATCGLDCQGTATESVVDLNGGKIHIDVVSTATGNSRAYGMFGKNIKEMNLNGTDIDLKVRQTNGVAYPGATSNGGISIQAAGVFTMTAGNLTVDLDDYTVGVFNVDNVNSHVNLKGGKLTGTAATLFAPFAANAVLNLEDAEIDLTLTKATLHERAATAATFKAENVVEGKVDTSATTGKFVYKPATTPETPETPTDVKVENPAAEVVITKADGTTVALNKDNKTTDGATYDPATGKLTLNGLNAKKIAAASGDVIVEVKGTNTLTNDEDVAAESKDTLLGDDGKAAVRVPGKLFFVGDGKLTVTAKGYNIYSETAITFTDNVNVELVSTGTVANAAAIYTPISSKTDDCVITFSGKAKVTGTTENGPIIRQGASPWAYGKLILQDEAELNMTVKQCNSWSAAAFVTHWEITGGTMNVDVTGKSDVAAISGFEVYAENTTREDRSATLKMTGGTVNIKVLAPKTDGGRPHGIFSLYASELDFTGGVLNLDVKTASPAPAASGAICVQWNNANDKFPDDKFVNVHVGGNVEINAKDCNSDALFATSNGNGAAKIAVVIDGGVIKGSDNAFIYDRNVQASTLEIKGGEIDWTSKTFNVKGATGTVTVSLKEGGVGPADTVIKTGTNPGTSDLAVALVSVIAVTSVVAAAAVLFVRKRRYN